jgi:hypothetical protein
MTGHRERPEAAFRLNLEQQKKRAKGLLKAARAADASALTRMRANDPNAGQRLRSRELRLADAQLVIARELGFSNWPALKSHIASLDRARTAIGDSRHPPDAEVKTLHLRCGSDIRPTLVEAGFCGDFLEHSYPYCHGPVTTGPDRYEQQARFLAALAREHINVSLADALEKRREEDRRLAASAEHYERVVLWMEHDCFDQLVLIRCLAHYASAGSPRILELIVVNHFPGSIRFVGLGQLPTEAIRLLWGRRLAVTPEQLVLATHAWTALTKEDPRPLAALMRTGTPALPELATALHRLLQELPSCKDGLGLTERLILQILSEESVTINHLFGLMTYERDPLFFATDLMLLQTVERMRAPSEPLLTRRSSTEHWRNHELAITDVGRTVLRGDRDWLSLRPPSRWVGGVQIGPGPRHWRWDDTSREASFT